MFRITRETDYGIVLLSHLAGEPPGTVHAARDLASCGQLPGPMVSKILKALARAGLLVSHRGSKGGYSLARGPEEISVADVIKALEGPLGMTECASIPGSCDQESVCPIRSRWQEISQTVVDFLARIRLTDLATSTPLPPMLLALGSRPAQGTCGS